MDLTAIAGPVLLTLLSYCGTGPWLACGLWDSAPPPPQPLAPRDSQPWLLHVWPLGPGEETHVETALMQQRDMLRKELALARVCRADSIPLNKSLVFSSSSIWRGTLLRSWVIWGR